MKFRIYRLLSDFIDLFICVLQAVFLTVIPAYLASGLKLGKTVLLILCVAMAYVFFLFRDFRGRSIGKRLFGLKVVNWEGKTARPFQRIRRNLSLVLFPLEIVLIIAGYDTIGDNLALTCVTDNKNTGAPGMKRGNNLMRIICLALFLSTIAIIVIYYAVSSLRITGSEGYKVLEDYMSGSVIAKEFGNDPLWRVEDYTKKSDNELVYSVTVNGETFDVTTVKILDDWFVYGVQSETVEKLEKLIDKAANENTERFALADMDGDDIPEVLEYFSDENGAHINVYSINSSEVCLTLDTKAHAGNARGDWRVYSDTDSKNKYVLIGIYSSYAESLSEKYVCMATKSDKGFESIISFKEGVSQISSVDEEGNTTVSHIGEYQYNGIIMPPSDYFSNYDSFFNKYVPVTEIITFVKWDAPEKGENSALMLAIDLVKKGWSYDMPNGE